MIFMEENNLLIKENIKYLVIHCSDTDENDKALDIHKLQLKFGWDGVGYHKIINKEGIIENGRPEYWVGAHVYKYNEASLGVCLIGRNNFNSLQMKSLLKVINEWKTRYPKAKILGHNEFPNSNKTCPNFDVQKWCKKNKLL